MPTPFTIRAVSMIPWFTLKRAGIWSSTTTRNWSTMVLFSKCHERHPTLFWLDEYLTDVWHAAMKWKECTARRTLFWIGPRNEVSLPTTRTALIVVGTPLSFPIWVFSNSKTASKTVSLEAQLLRCVSFRNNSTYSLYASWLQNSHALNLNFQRNRLYRPTQNLR